MAAITEGGTRPLIEDENESSTDVVPNVDVNSIKSVDKDGVLIVADESRHGAKHHPSRIDQRHHAGYIPSKKMNGGTRHAPSDNLSKISPSSVGSDVLPYHNFASPTATVHNGEGDTSQLAAKLAKTHGGLYVASGGPSAALLTIPTIGKATSDASLPSRNDRLASGTPSNLPTVTQHAHVPLRNDGFTPMFFATPNVTLHNNPGGGGAAASGGGHDRRYRMRNIGAKNSGAAGGPEAIRVVNEGGITLLGVGPRNSCSYTNPCHRHATCQDVVLDLYQHKQGQRQLQFHQQQVAQYGGMSAKVSRAAKNSRGDGVNEFDGAVEDFKASHTQEVNEEGNNVRAVGGPQETISAEPTKVSEAVFDSGIPQNINAPRGVHCQCNSGYEGDGLTCVDIDECAVGRTRAINAAAAANGAPAHLEAVAAAIVAAAATGGDSTERAKMLPSWLSSGTSELPCGLDKCVNSEGSFSCECHDGFTKQEDGECLALPNVCESGGLSGPAVRCPAAATCLDLSSYPSRIRQREQQNDIFSATINALSPDSVSSSAAAILPNAGTVAALFGAAAVDTHFGSLFDCRCPAGYAWNNVTGASGAKCLKINTPSSGPCVGNGACGINTLCKATGMLWFQTTVCNCIPGYVEHEEESNSCVRPGFEKEDINEYIRFTTSAEHITRHGDPPVAGMQSSKEFYNQNEDLAVKEHSPFVTVQRTLRNEIEAEMAPPTGAGTHTLIGLQRRAQADGDGPAETEF